MRKRIACDVDGVLADLVTELCFCLRQYGHSYKPEDVKHFDFSKTFTPEALERANYLMGSPTFCRTLPWYYGARFFLSQLRDLGDLVIATAPFDSPTWSSERREWLAPHVHKNDILSVPSKHKAAATKFCDVLVEDRVETLEDWSRERPGGLAILIDRPWNQGNYPFAVRAKSYREAIETIREAK